MRFLPYTDPQIAEAIKGEIERQQRTLVLIASENFASPSVLEAQGSVLTNKYAEGYPGRRYYGGCKFVDKVEEIAKERAKELFGAEHVNVQPHSGTQANIAVYFATLKKDDVILGMDLRCGGHLTHGARVNFSGAYFNVFFYGIKREDELIDFEQIESLCKKYNPRLIICGASSYPRKIEFERFAKIAKKFGALLLADIAHIAGLVAAGLHPTPFPFCDFVTTTTHKTLRGPRGGMIMCKKEWAEAVDKAVFPGTQGGPLMHIIAAKAVCFLEAKREEFKGYQTQVIKNAKTLSAALIEEGFRIVTGGTDTHMLVVDLSPLGMNGKEAEETLEREGIVVNKNVIPFDPLPPAITSGIRIGTAAVTTRGMKEEQMQEIATLIADVLRRKKRVREEVCRLCKEFPLYKELP